MKPTPGPWTVVNDVDVRSEQPGFLAYISTAGARGRTLDEAKANATLIAAAPCLLAACEAMLSLSIPGMNWTDKIGLAVLNAARAAIKKARGES